MRHIVYCIYFVYLLVVNSTPCLGSDKVYIQLSNDASISILTCGTGEEIYSLYGHSALRVKDPLQNIDVVFNYGTFDFDTPFFVAKFLRGTLDYMLSAHNYNSFERSYRNDNRSVTEIKLPLDSLQRCFIWHALLTNIEPQNRFYRYNFMFDNCATRIRDIILKYGIPDSDSISVYGVINQPSGVSFRQAMHQITGTSSWIIQGIDIILGRLTDNECSIKDLAFLPANIPDFLSNGVYSNKKITEYTLVQTEQHGHDGNSLVYFILLTMSILIILYTYYDYKNIKYTKSVDITLFTIISIVSLIVVYMSFISAHTICHQNINILWANPLSLIILFNLPDKKPKNHFSFKICKFLYVTMLCLLSLFILLSVFGVQDVPLVALCCTVVLLIRTSYMLYTLLTVNKNHN